MARILRVWFRPNGLVGHSDLSPLPPERQGAEWARILADRSLPPDTPYVDMDAADLPPRARRHAWRKHPTELRVVVDPTVPDPPHPKKKLLDAIDQAATVDDLKALLKKVVTA